MVKVPVSFVVIRANYSTNSVPRDNLFPIWFLWWSMIPGRVHISGHVRVAVIMVICGAVTRSAARRLGVPGPAGGDITHCSVPWASGPLGRCALVYMDDGLVHSPSNIFWMWRRYSRSFAVAISKRRALSASSGPSGDKRSASWGIACRPLACLWTREMCSRSGNGRRRRHAPRSNASLG